MSKLRTILAEEGLVDDEVAVTVTLKGPAEVVRKVCRFIETARMLGSIGSSRFVRVDIDGDGPDRLKVEGLDDYKFDVSLEEDLSDDTITVT